MTDNFVWGVSTASYQIEGAVNEDGRGPSIWDTFCRQKGRVANGDTGDVACDHYHRFAQDIALMRDLGVGAYRFSIAWPRVLPSGRGAANELGLLFYDRLIDALLAAGIEPWICLYHWDLPQALDDRGGWTNRDCAGWFADYATLAARRYGDRVKRFATFNEPTLFTLLGYGLGWHAPGLADRAALLRAIHHVSLAHGAGVDTLRAHVPGASIGAIYNYQPSVASTPDDESARDLLDAFWNRSMPDPQLTACYPPLLARELDTIGLPGDLARMCRPVDGSGSTTIRRFMRLQIRARSWVSAWLNRRPTSSALGLDGRSIRMPFAIRCSPFISGFICRSMSWRTVLERAKCPTTQDTSSTGNGSPICDPIPTRCGLRCRRERVSAAISCGR
jgi:beta-glucosidase